MTIAAPTNNPAPDRLTMECDPIYARAVTRVTRQAQRLPRRDAWPSVNVGQMVCLADGKGWIWDARITEVIECGEVVAVELLGERIPSPMPEPVISEDGMCATVSLSNMTGHAHFRDWRASDIVRLSGRPWKVRGAPRFTSGGTRTTYRLVPATDAQWAMRHGRVDLGGDLGVATAAVGTVVEVRDEWLAIKKITYRTFHGAMGAGRIYIGHGRFVSRERAGKINAALPANRLAVAISDGERMVRGWVRPAGADEIAVERRMDSVQPDEMVVAGRSVYLIDPVYDDDPRVTLLALTPAKARKLARDLGWSHVR